MGTGRLNLMTKERKAYLLSLVQYPQLTASESNVARAWLEKHADEWDDVDFNVRLGTQLQLGEGFNDTTRAQAALLSQKRADLVATRGTEAAIIEVKIRIALAALGQLLGYQVLWRAEYPLTTTVDLIVELLQAHGVSVELFPNVALAVLPYG